MTTRENVTEEALCNEAMAEGSELSTAARLCTGAAA